MKKVNICRADPIGEIEVQPVTIVVSGLLPQVGEELELAFDLDAGCLAKALFYSLPEGTLDKLIIKLMKRKTSVYRGITRG